MSLHNTSNFKATALNDDALRQQAPSVFALGPMQGLSGRYTFVPTARILADLRTQDWVPVSVEEQRIRTESRRGFQKHLIRLRQAGQMDVLDRADVWQALRGHTRGDWGEYADLCGPANAEALEKGLQLVSIHHDRHGTMFLIVTSADRSTTTVLVAFE